jgi:hypothetical protein
MLFLLGVFYFSLIGVALGAYINRQRKQEDFYFGLIYVVLAIASLSVAFHASVPVHFVFASVVSYVTLVGWVVSCAEDPIKWRPAIILPIFMMVVYALAVLFAVWLMADANAHGVAVTYVILPVITVTGLFLTYTTPGQWLWRQTGLKSRL